MTLLRERAPEENERRRLSGHQGSSFIASSSGQDKLRRFKDRRQAGRLNLPRSSNRIHAAWHMREQEDINDM